MKKFELTSETKVNTFGVTLFRIKATVAFKSINIGELGGWVEKESNLSGDAWVYGDARVSGDAWVSGNARVYGNARVSGDAWVYGDARVSGNARVYGNARVSGNAEVSGNARVYGNARVCGDAEVYGDARVSGNARVSKKVYTANFKWNLTLTDLHIAYGCVMKTVGEWVEWLDGSEEYETKRYSPDFKIIEMSLRLAIEQHKLLNQETK